jgi:hypothetical protein
VLVSIEKFDAVRQRLVFIRMATSVDIYAQILGAGQFGLTSERGVARQGSAN